MPRATASNRMVVRDDEDCLLFGAAVGDKIEVASIGGTVGDTWSTIIRAKYKSGSYGNTLEARVWNKGTDLIRTTSIGGLAVAINGTAFSGLAGFFLFDNKWHDYAITYDGANIRGYRDGILIGNIALVATATDTASVFTVGNRASGSRSIDGYVSQFLHYKNRVLTLEDFENFYFNAVHPGNTNLHIWYKLDEASGATANDSSGNGYHGTITGATWSLSGPFKNRATAQNGRKYLVFDGVDDYIEIADNSAFSIPTTGELSVSFWMRPDILEFPNDGAGGYVNFLGKGEVGQYEWNFRLHSATNTDNTPGKISFYIFNLAGGLGVGSRLLNGVDTAGEWIHVAAAVDSTYIYLFVNGVQVDSDEYPSYPITPANGTAPLRIGTLNLTTYFLGAIRDVRIFNRKLATSEVLAVKNGMTISKGLVARYKLDSTTILDSSGSGLDGTNNGSSLGTDARTPATNRPAV